MAATFAQLAFVNSNASPTSTGSVTPGASKVLFAWVQDNGADDGTLALTGTIGGTWTLVRRDRNFAQNRALYWCTNYNASGTVTGTKASATWITIELFTATDTGLSLSNPIQQSTFWDATDHGGNSVTVRVDLTTVPTRSTFMCYSMSALFSAAGTGMTDLVHDQTWSFIGVATAPTGRQSMTMTQNAVNAWWATGCELRYSTGNHFNGDLPRIGWRR